MIKVDIHKVKDGEKKGTTACRVEESLDKNDDPALGLAFRAAVMAALLGKPFGGDDDKEDGDKS